MTEPTWLALESLLRALSGLATPIELSQSLRDDLHLDSFRLLELTVLIHERFGVDLGLLAARGEVFLTVQDLTKHLGAER